MDTKNEKKGKEVIEMGILAECPECARKLTSVKNKVLLLRDSRWPGSWDGGNGRGPTVLPKGITKRKSHRAQTIAKHADEVEETKKEAKESSVLGPFSAGSIRDGSRRFQSKSSR